MCRTSSGRWDSGVVSPVHSTSGSTSRSITECTWNCTTQQTSIVSQNASGTVAHNTQGQYHRMHVELQYHRMHVELQYHTIIWNCTTQHTAAVSKNAKGTAAQNTQPQYHRMHVELQHKMHTHRQAMLLSGTLKQVAAVCIYFPNSPMPVSVYRL